MESVGEFSLPESAKSAIKEIAQKRILFAHHSVGANIIAGLQTLAMQSGVSLSVGQLEGSIPAEGGIVLNLSPGINRQPKTKIDEFVEEFEKNRELDIDIAFLKFCYVDFTPESEVKEILNYYKRNIERLKQADPDVVFIHITVPLTVKSTTYKDRLKRLFGLQVWGDASNMVRGQYNDLLLQTFPEDQVFDLARIESTRVDGSRVESMCDRKVVYGLAREYTNDGGHLNVLGQRVVASEIVMFLMNVLALKNK